MCVLVVLLCATGIYTRQLMLLAQSENMTNGYYVFARLNIVPRPNVKNLWTASSNGLPEDGKDALAKLAMVTMFQVMIIMWHTMHGCIYFFYCRWLLYRSLAPL